METPVNLSEHVMLYINIFFLQGAHMVSSLPKLIIYVSQTSPTRK
jgi:hypothetical protein